MTETATTHPPRVSESAAPAWIGLAALSALMLAAVLVPPLFGWEVYARNDDADSFPPLHGYWQAKVGVGTIPAVVLAVLGWRYAVRLADAFPWRGLLAASYAGGLAWLLALAYVDGESGITRVLGNRYEYLMTAREVTSVSGLLHEFVDRIPYAAPDNWVTHVAGHPPGALLVFVGLDRVGLGGDLAAGLVVTLVAATIPLAVLVTLRALGVEGVARRAAPYLVLGPAAVFLAVSADALFAAVAAWGLTALAIAASRERRASVIVWSVLAGLLLGSCVLLSYGLPLLGFLAIAVLIAARSWLPLPVAAGAALLVVLLFAAGGFSLWEAYPVLQERYWDGVAKVRPASYWMWGNLAALGFCAGPMLGAGLGSLVANWRRSDRVATLLVGAAALAILTADVSRMSKGEVERIWLPFVPWLMIATAALPDRWRRPAVAVQVGFALLLQHLLYTSW